MIAYTFSVPEKQELAGFLQPFLKESGGKEVETLLQKAGKWVFAYDGNRIVGAMYRMNNDSSPAGCFVHPSYEKTDVPLHMKKLLRIPCQYGIQSSRAAVPIV